MKLRIILLITSYSLSLPTYAEVTQTPTNPPQTPSPTPQFKSYKKERSQALKSQNKSQLTPEEQKRIKERVLGRKVQEYSEPVVDATYQIEDFLFHLPLALRMQHATGAVAVLNFTVRGIAIGVRSIGRWKEAAQNIFSANEQLLEAATQSYEKIDHLSKTLEDLLGQKTVIDAVKDVKSDSITRSKKILSLLSPTNYLNTFDKFTDALYITDNKADRWEKIQQATKDLKEEESRFDDYIAMIKIKILERLIRDLDAQQNTDATLKTLQDSLNTNNKAIEVQKGKIQDLNNKKLQTSGIGYHMKRIVGKDDLTQYTKSNQQMVDELSGYMQQKTDLEAKIQQHQKVMMAPDAEKKQRVEGIKQQRAQIMTEISNIKGRRVAKATPDEMADMIADLQKQMTDMRVELDQLKGVPKA